MDAYAPEAFFAPYRERRSKDWYADDPILRGWLAKHRVDGASLRFAERCGRDAATRWREHADSVERPEKAPHLVVPPVGTATSEDVRLPEETQRALAEVHGSRLWHGDLDERARYAAVYLLGQNGEWGVMCSVACTDGLLRALRALGADARSREIVDRLERSTPARWLHGAQFVTEIQGGSDAATNRVQAEPGSDGLWKLHGRKWFCSNLTADYWLVTARPRGAPEGARGIGLFCVPRQWEGRPNGHVVERLKDKVGTRALATAEIRLEGARGWPLGPLDAGLRSVLAHVLTTSRIHNVLGCAALLREAAREARAYAEFRLTFGARLVEHPLPAESLARLEAASGRTSAAALAVVDAWIEGRDRDPKEPAGLAPRVLLSLAKAVTARRASRFVYDAMMLLGGNGIEERFGPLPRLWRDAAIYETWEGPYTLLLMQALDDLVRFGAAGREEVVLEPLVGHAPASKFAGELKAVLADPTDARGVRSWGELAPRIYEAFEDRVLAEFQKPPQVGEAR